MKPFQMHDGSTPKSLIVFRCSEDSSATNLYGIVADYGWCERILCVNSYRVDVVTMASILVKELGIPVHLNGHPNSVHPNRVAT